MKHVPDSRFSIGDRVVRTREGICEVGTPATIVALPNEYFPGDYEIELLGGTAQAWHTKNMELESIYNSPLYKALR